MAPTHTLASRAQAVLAQGQRDSDGEFCVAGEEATLGGWVQFARGFVARWVDRDFTWDGVPLGQFLGRVEVDLPGQATLVLCERGGPAPASRSVWGANDVEAMLEWWTHEVWGAVAGAWALEGRWLHPDTTLCDPVAFYQSYPLVIGVRDRLAPSAPRRFDPERMAWANDLGCVSFPTHSMYRIVQWASEGYGPEDISRMVAMASVVDAAVHESLEMYQREVGVPFLDPHQMSWPAHEVRASVRVPA